MFPQSFHSQLLRVLFAEQAFRFSAGAILESLDVDTDSEPHTLSAAAAASSCSPHWAAPAEVAAEVACSLRDSIVVSYDIKRSLGILAHSLGPTFHDADISSRTTEAATWEGSSEMEIGEVSHATTSAATPMRAPAEAPEAAVEDEGFMFDTNFAAMRSSAEKPPPNHHVNRRRSFQHQFPSSNDLSTPHQPSTSHPEAASTPRRRVTSKRSRASEFHTAATTTAVDQSGQEVDEKVWIRHPKRLKLAKSNAIDPQQHLSHSAHGNHDTAPTGPGCATVASSASQPVPAVSATNTDAHMDVDVHSSPLEADENGVFPFAGTAWWDGKQEGCVVNAFADNIKKHGSSTQECVEIAQQCTWFTNSMEGGLVDATIPGAFPASWIKPGIPRLKVLEFILRGTGKQNWSNETCSIVAYLYVLHPTLRRSNWGKMLLSVMGCIPEYVSLALQGFTSSSQAASEDQSPLRRVPATRGMINARMNVDHVGSAEDHNRSCAAVSDSPAAAADVTSDASSLIRALPTAAASASDFLREASERSSSTNLRWKIVRHDRKLLALSKHIVASFGEPMRVDTSKHWGYLKVEQRRKPRSLQRDLFTFSFVNETTLKLVEDTMRQVLIIAGVPNVEKLHCTSIKLLASPPLAGRQKRHVDVPRSKTIHKLHRRDSGIPKAPQCISMVLHLNGGSTAGTHVPTLTPAAMNQLIQEWIRCKKNARICDDKIFTSHTMSFGDLLLFFNDVVHFGPANLSSTEWRWVLFVHFSPEEGPNQDSNQDFFKCGGK
jgi:hypothetical protein